MITLGGTQQTIVDSSLKLVSWLFEITDGTAAPDTNYWSTKAHTFAAQPYTYKILPGSFKGVTLNRSRSEMGIRGANNLSFSISNRDNTLTASDFIGGSVLLKLVVSDGTNEEIIRQWKFNVKDCRPAYQQLNFECEDFIRKYLRGDYPNTRRVRDIFYSDDVAIDDDVCVPLPFGTCYVPLHSIYVPEAISINAATISATATANGSRCKISDSGNGFGDVETGRYITVTGFTEAANNGTFRVLKASAGEIELSIDAGLVTEAAGDSVTVKQGSRYYMLGSPTPTYTISKVRSPREWGKKSEWESGSFNFNQSTKTDSDGADWRMFQPVIADIDKDGTADAQGLWKQGDRFLDMPVKFSRSDTSAKTNPADVIAYVLEDFGIDAADIDTGAGSSFEAAASIYTGWGLEFNGAFWKKESREKILAQLLLQCHSTFQITDKIELHVLSKTSRKTIAKPEILAGTFQREANRTDNISDCGHVLWQPTNEAQDKFLNILVGAKATKSNISNKSIEVPFVQDSQDVQRIGQLYFQRKFLPSGKIKDKTKGTCLALQPDDMTTINHADYGGNYKALIDSMTINRDLSIAMSCILFSDDFDDWGDLSPGAITIVADDTSNAWDLVVSGPQSSEDLGTGAYDVWGNPYLTVGPNTNMGQFTSIQAAINALADSRHSGIFILDGTYPLDAPIYPIDRDMEIKGESQGGVIIQNHAGDDCFVLHNLTKVFQFSNFSFDSQVSADGHDKFYIYGDTYAQNTAKVEISKIVFDLDGSVYDDYGINISKVSGRQILIDRCIFNNAYFVLRAYDDIYAPLKIINCTLDNFIYGIHSNSLAKLEILNNALLDTGYTGIWLPGATGTTSVVGNKIASKSNMAGHTFHGIQANGGGSEGLFQGNEITCAAEVPAAQGMYITGSRHRITDNIINIDIDWHTSVQLARGIYTGVSDSEMANNIIRIDAVDVSNNHQGIYASGDRNIIQGNNIDMVNGAAQDIGIELTAAADNNQGGDNITHNCGTSISDAGTGNTVTAKDV